MRSKEEILDIVCDLYEELNISSLGFDLPSVIKSLGINLIPYSSYDKSEQKILVDFDQDGFNLINSKNSKIEIYYNDLIAPHNRIKFTLPHELGHICLGHNCDLGGETKEKKNEADLFSNELYCPQAFMIVYGLKTVSDLISTFDITDTYAAILLDKLSKRMDMNLTKNEKRLIEIFERNKK